jgi:EIX receptor 1/2
VKLCLNHAFGVGDEKIVCAERGKQALLNLKHELTDGFGRLSSWGTENNIIDCCRRKGVGCDNKTGNVITLDLHGPQCISTYSSVAPLRGEISLSLFELKHLKYLDLSYNEFSGNILSNISSFSILDYLNLSRSGFYSGAVPPKLETFLIYTLLILA